MKLSQARKALESKAVIVFANISQHGSRGQIVAITDDKTRAFVASPVFDSGGGYVPLSAIVHDGQTPPMFYRGQELVIIQDLGFAEEGDDVSVVTGNVCMRDPYSSGMDRVPCLRVERGGYQYWLSLSRLYHRNRDGSLSPPGYLSREWQRRNSKS